MPPALSMCNNDMTVDVVSTNPSRTVDATADVVSANLRCIVYMTGDVVSANPSHAVDATDDVVSDNPSRTMDMTGNVVSTNTRRVLDATGDVTRANPSCTVDMTGDVVSADPIPSLSVYNSTGIHPPQDPISILVKVTHMAPNRLVNWNILKSVVNKYIDACGTCYLKGMRLEEKVSCAFATDLEIICGTCDNHSEKNRLEISYLTKKVDAMKIITKKEKVDRRQTQLKRNHLQHVQKTRILPGRVSCQIEARHIEKVSCRERLRPIGKAKILWWTLRSTSVL